MKTCFQSKGQSILQHGESVHEYYLDLHHHLFNGEALKLEWRLPDWLMANKDFIKSKLYDLELLRDYHIYHDCGKPLCVTIDAEGKQHFPNHAQASFDRWTECSIQDPRNAAIGRLILMDMDMHTVKAEGLLDMSKRPEAISLLITALCEIHSNASMFGGIESTSFKIKWKHLDKRGRQLINLIKEQSCLVHANTQNYSRQDSMAG
jgi:hypothetical protein